MAGRHRKFGTAARRVMLPAVGAIPLALVVGCSSTTHQAGSSTSTSASTTSENAPTQETQPSQPTVPGTAVTPPSSQQPGPLPSIGTTGTPQPGVTPSGVDSLYSPHTTLQPGVTPEATPQPGVTAPAPDIVTPNYVVPPNFRPIPQDENEPAPAVDWTHLHAPTAVKPVKPIAPPPRTLRLGNFTSPVPDYVPNDVLNNVNVTAANAEANLSTSLNSVGINPSRSDKVAAGALAGAALGATVAGVPAAAVGGVVGGVIGGVVAAPGGVLGTAVGGVPGPVIEGAGIAIGAAAGAAVAGIPAAVVGGAIGGVAGAAIGSAV